MAVTLRLARYGAKGNVFYRIVASPKGSKRDGRFLENLGTFLPMVNPARVTLKEDRVRYWIENGAQVTKVVSDLIRKNIPGYLEGKLEGRTKKIQAARKARKARSSGKAAKPKAAKAAKAAAKSKAKK